jgi:hypothetical protein
LQLFHLDVAKKDRGYCQCCICCKCFQRHVANVCSKCFIYFHMYVAMVFLSEYCNSMFLNVSVLCCNKWFNVASCKRFILDVSCVSHICCRIMFLNVLSVFSLICCTHVASILYCSAGSEPGAGGRGTRRVKRPAEGGCCDRDTLEACSSVTS